jgi:hemoglobin-like flavoprotein
MNSDQVILIRESWSSVAANADALSTRFYTHLFEIDDGAARLFAGADMKAQRTKLVHALTLVVASVDDPDRLLPALAALGKRHAGYGIEERHFDSVGDAFLWALNDVMGDAFTPELRDVWARAYALIASIMRRALGRHQESASGEPSNHGTTGSVMCDGSAGVA